MTRKIPLLLALTTLVSSASVRAEDRLVLTGVEAAGDSYYSYAGLILPGPGRANGQGFLQRYWIDRFGYDYQSSHGRIEARGTGAEAALGYGRSSSTGWSTISLGVRYTDTELTPDDPEAAARGSQFSAKFQVEGERALGPRWRAGAIASYVGRQDGYWGRVRITRALTSAQTLGLDLIVGGNDDYDSTAAGLVYGLRPVSGRWTLGLKAGFRRQDGDEDAYGGLEFGYGF